MSELFQRIRDLAARREVFVSDHGYEELAADGILIRDVFAGIGDGVALEEYPSYHKGPCVLVLQRDHDGNPIHVVWGIPAEAESPAVIVTAYRPDPRRWSDDFLKRRT